MKCVEYKGYTVSQTDNCHISIRKNGKRVFHAVKDVLLNDEELMMMVNDYLDIIGANYVVRYGNDNNVERSFYMTKKQADEFYNKIELNTDTTWKEFLYEPLEKENVQEIIKSDSEKVVDCGICKIAVPE